MVDGRYSVVMDSPKTAVSSASPKEYDVTFVASDHTRIVVDGSAIGTSSVNVEGGGRITP